MFTLVGRTGTPGNYYYLVTPVVSVEAAIKVALEQRAKRSELIPYILQDDRGVVINELDFEETIAAR